MKKYGKIILIPPHLAFGDCLSVIGLLYYLLNHYDMVYFYLGESGSTLMNYFNDYFSHDPKYGDRIILTANVETLINSGSYGDYHICNTLTDNWKTPQWWLSDLPNINKEYYFNDVNPINNKLDITSSYVTSPNKHLPNNTIGINHLFYYELIGLNNKVRMDYFNYVRDVSNEEKVKQDILQQFNVFDKYNIINDPIGKGNELTPYIDNDYPTININYLSPSPGNLILLLEGAESIHFIEGCNVNFFYHCQYKNIFKYEGVINFHVWARNRDWMYGGLNLDYAWKMMETPKLNNWNFKFNK